MFRRIQEYRPIEMKGRWYKPRAYGDPQSDGTWNGWVVFFTLSGRSAIAPPSPETTQSNLGALALWAESLTLLDLEAALARALAVTQQTPLIDQLDAAEYRGAQGR